MLKSAFLIGILFFVIAFSGCLASSDNYATRYEYREQTSTPIPVSTYRSIADDNGNTPSIQNINGVNKVQDVSGKIIRINGNYNEIRNSIKMYLRFGLMERGILFIIPKKPVL